MAEPVKNEGWLISGLYNGLQKISVPVFGIITTMLLAKKALTKEEMGVWVLFLVVTSFVELIRQALVKTAMIKFINYSAKKDHPFVLSAAFLLNCLITFLLIIILAVFASVLSGLLKAPGLDDMMYWFLIGMTLLILFSHFEWMMYSHSMFKELFSIYFFRQGITLLLMVIWWLMKGQIGLTMLVVFFNIGIAVGAFVGYRYVKHLLSYTFILRGEWFSQLWHFGKYVFGSGISTLVFTNAAQMMLSPLLGSTAFTASQSMATRVINLTDMPSQVVSDILFPKSSNRENAANKGLIRYYYEKSVGATLSFAIPMVIFILLFPKFIILFLADEQYLDGVPYLQIIAVTAMFLAFLKQWGVIIDSSGKPEINFRLITFIALLNVILSYILIKQIGFLGAAYALVLSHIVAFIITQWLLHKYYGISIIKCFKYAIQFYPEMIKIVLSKIR